MARKNAKQVVGKIESKIQSLVDSTNAADIVIMGMGFWAGFEGGTILDTFFSPKNGQSGSHSLNPFQPSIEKAKSDPVVGAIMAGAGYIGFAATLNPFVAQWMQNEVSPYSVQATQAQAQALTPEQNKLLTDATKAKVAMGCIGAIAAYAFTRPGFLPALMGMAGDIVKDFTSLPIVV